MKKTILLIVTILNMGVVTAQWQNSQMDSINVHCLVTNDSNIFVGAQGGVYISNDYGNTWTFSNNGFPINIGVYTIATDGINIFAGTKSNPGTGGVYRSNNGGSSWNLVNNGLINTNISSVIINGTTVLAGTDAGVFLSNNNGNLWTIVNGGLPNSTFYSFATNGTNIFVGTEHGVFVSNTNGNSWTSINTGITDSSTYSIAVDGSTVYAGTTTKGLFISTNNGGLWTPANIGITDSAITSIVVNGANIFTGTANDGIFLSTNSGSSWTQINTGLPFNTIYSLAISGTNIYTVLSSVTFFKIRKRPLSELGLVGLDEPTKKDFLKMCPNPATDQLNIIFNDATATEAIVEIHDLLGKLIEHVPLKSGVAYNYNTQSLQKSIYLVSLYINGKLVDNQKMVLIK